MRLNTPLVVLSLAVLAAGCHQGERMPDFGQFGADFAAVQLMSLQQVVARADTLGDQRVSIEGRIKEVCQTRGCWMTLTDGANEVRVRFTASDTCVDGFVVPRNAAGHQAYIRAFVKSTQIPESEARHYAEDQGKSPAEIARIVGPQKEITLVAEGVMISDPETLDDPVK